MRKIVILGTGVLGWSTALALISAGYGVRLVGERRMTDPDARRFPLFASAHPAASIIAHSVVGSETARLMKSSAAIFETLAGSSPTGVRLQRHMELFEDRLAVSESEPPSHYRAFRPIGKEDQKRLPRRRGVDEIFGYAFDCFFCDMPRYGPWLEQTATKAGGAFSRGILGPRSPRDLEGDLIVNCLGSGASSVFPELSPGTLVRGVLVEARIPAPETPPLSYNYTPRSHVFRDRDGHPADVYYYPRRETCVLGGTREPGVVDSRTGEFLLRREPVYETVRISGIDVPKPILTLNLDLVRQLTGTEPTPPYRASVGFRHLAGTADDPRYEIGLRTIGERPVVDCYGFGGAGVTLSWGAALRVVEMCDGYFASDGSDREQRVDQLKDLLRNQRP